MIKSNIIAGMDSLNTEFKHFSIITAHDNSHFILKLKGNLARENFTKLKEKLEKFDFSYKRREGFITQNTPNTNDLAEIDDLLSELKKAQKEHVAQTISEFKEMYSKFMESKTIKDVIGAIGNFKVFHHYSMRNLILAFIQSEQREMKNYKGILNSYANWKKLGYYVKRNQKGLSIIVPMIQKYKEIDPKTSKEEEKVSVKFKFGKTFDISQTTALEDYEKQQEALEEKVYKNAEIDYDQAKQFVESHFPEITITEDFKEQEKKGHYRPTTKEIRIFNKSSSTMFHEIGHHISFQLKIAFKDWKTNKSSYAKNEILAELGCFLLTKAFDENARYNFAYSNIWSSKITDEFTIEEFTECYKVLTAYFSNFFTLDLKKAGGDD